MAKQVYANNEEVACKAGIGKSICALPDVCMTPPENPATPPGVPVPYPNTGMDSDTTDGSRSVQINGKEAMLKNKSYFKKSMGDEAGCAAKKGVVTSVNRGKVYFIAWAMDVKFEGENVVRNLDMTTHNHASPVPNTPPQIFAARMALANIPGCEGQRQAVEGACGKNGENFSCPADKPLKDAKAARQAAKDAAGDSYKKDPTYIARNQDVNSAIDQMATENRADDCRRKMRCLLSPYDPDICCPGQTPHHLVEASAFYEEGREAGWVTKKNVVRATFVHSLKEGTTVVGVKSGRGQINVKSVFGAEKYDEGAALSVCCEGESQHQGTHRLLHQAQDVSARAAAHVPNPNLTVVMTTDAGKPAKMRRLDNAITSGAQAVQAVFPESACDQGCIEAQLADYHYNKANMNPQLPIKACGGDGKALPAP